MDNIELTLRVVMTVSTIVLFLYGLLKGYDKLELLIYNIYFVALILYLTKTNFFKEEKND